jgi:hypothetical protein
MLTRSFCRTVATVAWIAVFGVVGAWAQDVSPRAEHAAGEESEEERNDIGLFVGATTDDLDGATGLTLGADYERRLCSRWGAGLLIDAVVGGELARDVIVAVLAAFHPTPAVRLLAAPGLEISEHGDTEVVLRIGGDYKFLAGHYGIAPGLFFDWTEGGRFTYVYGLTFSRGF